MISVYWTEHIMSILIFLTLLTVRQKENTSIIMAMYIPEVFPEQEHSFMDNQ